MKKYSEKELSHTTSDYLCDNCHKLIYINEKDKEICINKSCKLCAKLQIIDDEFIDKEYDKRIKTWNKSLQNFQIFSKLYFKQRLHDIRHDISISSWKKGRLGSWDLIHINSIFVDCANNKFGSSKDLGKFERIFEQSRSAFDKLNQFEHLKSGDSKYTDDKYQIYESKYGRIIRNEYLKYHGIIYSTGYDHDSTNQYKFIINQRKTKDVTDMRDFETFFRKNYDVVEQLFHTFQMTPKIHNIHKYSATASEITILFQFMSIMNAGKHGRCTEKYLKNIYQKILRSNDMKYDFETFKKNYCGNTWAPLLVYDGKEYHFDFETLYTHLLYIFGLNKKIEGTMYRSGYETLQNEREKSAEIFEREIRKILRVKNFAVYPEEGEILKVKINNIEYQYDAIAIDDDEKRIILIEAKFRNLSSASITVSNFIPNIILDTESGLLHFAKQHNNRVQFFKNNHKKIISNYNFSKLIDYKLSAYVITKFTPMIDSYLSIELMSYNKFKTMLNNNDFK